MRNLEFEIPIPRHNSVKLKWIKKFELMIFYLKKYLFHENEIFVTFPKNVDFRYFSILY